MIILCPKTKNKNTSGLIHTAASSTVTHVGSDELLFIWVPLIYHVLIAQAQYVADRLLQTLLE